MLDDNLNRVELNAYVNLQFEDFGFLKDSDEKFKGVDKSTIKAYRKELRNIQPAPPLIPKATPNKRLETVKGEYFRKNKIRRKRFKDKKYDKELKYIVNEDIYKNYKNSYNKKLRQIKDHLPINQRAAFKKIIT